MDREEFIELLTRLLAEIEYGTLIDDPDKQETVYRTAFQTVSLRPKSALKTILRHLNKNEVHELRSQIEENAVAHGFVSADEVEGLKYPAYFTLLFWGLIGLAAFGAYKAFL